MEADRAAVRRTVPRVLNTADSYELEHDPLARIARLPGAAWRAAKDGLERGPVRSRWRGRATRRRLPATTAGNRRAVPPAAGHWPSPGPAGALPCRSPVVFDAGAGGAAARATVSGSGGAPPGRCARPRNWAALPGQAGCHLIRGPGTGHGSGFESPGCGHGRRGTGRRRRLRGGAAARRRFAAAPREPAGGGGRRPALVQRRGPGPARGRRRPGGHHRGRRRRRRVPCCAGTPPATPSGNCPCARNCSCPRPSGSRPLPAAGPPSGTSARPLSSSWARRGSCCGPPARRPS